MDWHVFDHAITQIVRIVWQTQKFVHGVQLKENASTSVPMKHVNTPMNPFMA
jgi:hypothetical protein